MNANSPEVMSKYEGPDGHLVILKDSRAEIDINGKKYKKVKNDARLVTAPSIQPSLIAPAAPSSPVTPVAAKVIPNK